MKKKFVGTIKVIKGQTISTEILLELMNTKTPVSIADIMHKDMRNLSMDVADSSADQNLWKSSESMGGGIEAVMHYLLSGPLETVDTVYVHSNELDIANTTADTLQGIYDAELPAYLVRSASASIETIVDDEFIEKEADVKMENTQVSKQAMAKQFWNENSGAVVNARKANTNKKDDVKMNIPKMKSTVAVEAHPMNETTPAPVTTKVPGLKPNVAASEAVKQPAPKRAPLKTTVKSASTKKPNWYTNPQYYPVLSRFNDIIDNMRHGRAVDAALGIEELVIVKTEDIKRYATRSNAKDYLFIIQIKTSGVVFDFPIKYSDEYSNAELYSESISFSREGGKLRPVFNFTHPNSVQVMAQCTCGHTFRGNTSFLYCPKCKTNHGKAEVSFSHPTIALTNGHQFARTTPTNVHIHPDTLALVMAIAQLKNGGDMNGIYTR